MTTGCAIEPGSLAPLPVNARVEQWWPQAGVMVHTDVVVGHGGFSTTMAALAAGVPQVVIPLFASDQLLNAERVAAVGAGVCLDGGPGAVIALAPAVAEVLGNPAYGEAAQGVAGAMAPLADASSSVSFLKEFTAEHVERVVYPRSGLGNPTQDRREPRAPASVLIADTRSMMLYVVVLLSWFLLSIPAILIVGRVLAASRRSMEASAPERPLPAREHALASR